MFRMRLDEFRKTKFVRVKSIDHFTKQKYTRVVLGSPLPQNFSPRISLAKPRDNGIRS